MKFTAMETSPRTGVHAAENRPYSVGTLKNYKDYYKHLENDPLLELKMAEVEEEDILDFCTRMSLKKIDERKDRDGKVTVPGRPMGGTRTFKGVVLLVRMAFKSYQHKNHKWLNPFSYLKAPDYESVERDALTEEEMLRLFNPGVIDNTMELVVCSLMFHSGLRRAEVTALKPEDLDWKTPKITVRRGWQLFDSKDRVVGPPKGKKPRGTMFDPILQEAILKLWEENGKHEYVVSYKSGRTPGPTWIRKKFYKWLERAGIELGGREIVPHCSRHSLASMLESQGVAIRYIEEILGHSVKESGRTFGRHETTKIYLHTPEKMIREVGEKITAAREKAKEAKPEQKPQEENNVLEFKAG
jgi:integrase